MNGGKPDGLPILAKYAKIDSLNIRYYPDSDESLIEAISCGVLFYMAFWSGSSILSFRGLTEFLSGHDSNICLAVVDVDGCSDALTQLPNFKPPYGGNGETAWIRDGVILATTSGTRGYEFFPQNLAVLLGET